MEDVKRYDYAGGMLEFDTGPFVRFTDYAALRAEVDRLTAERDALARRMRVVEMRVLPCMLADGTYWLDSSGRVAFVIYTLNDDARARGYWSSASAALDAAADALEEAGLMEASDA